MRKSVVLSKQTRKKSCEKEWARLETLVKNSRCNRIAV